MRLGGGASPRAVYAAVALAYRSAVGGHGSSKSCDDFPLARLSVTLPEVNQTALKDSTAMRPLDSATARCLKKSWNRPVRL